MMYVNLIHLLARRSCDVCDRTCRNWREHIRPKLHWDIVHSGLHYDALLAFFFIIEHSGTV